MTLDRSELMKTAWAAANDRMQRFSYAQRQLRAVFAVELAKAWRNAKRRAYLAQRSVSDTTAEIAFTENKTRLGADGLERLFHERNQAIAAEQAAYRASLPITHETATKEVPSISSDMGITTCAESDSIKINKLHHYATLKAPTSDTE